MGFSLEVIKKVGEKRGWKCEVCGKKWCDGWILEAYQRIPRYAGGKSTKKNLMILCLECHYSLQSQREERTNRKGSSGYIKKRLDKTGGRWK